jgi:hypothetical protein
VSFMREYIWVACEFVEWFMSKEALNGLAGEWGSSVNSKFLFCMFLPWKLKTPAYVFRALCWFILVQ